MSLCQLGHADQGRELFLEAESEMPALPASLAGVLVDGQLPFHDRLIWWLAYREAEVRIFSNEPAKR